MRKGSHTVTRLTCHIVWITKYRYHVLKGEVQYRCRALLIQICDVEEVKILKGVVSKDHVHIHIEYPPTYCSFEVGAADEGTHFEVTSEGISKVRRAVLG